MTAHVSSCESSDVTEIHSRSIAAGYDPAVLQAATVLVVGAGALGQNVILNLALAGIGRLLIVDHDRFEPHNATRSPLFPTPGDRDRWGDAKACVVAHRVIEHMTAHDPTVLYATSPIQQLGDGVFRFADAVVAAVDNPRARAWLTERAKVHRTPLFEGGFSGPGFTIGAFDADPTTACYRCLNPELEGVFSCTRYANLAATHQIIPAIQTTAAVAAGYLTEQLIMGLHGRTNTYTRLFGDLRTLTATPARPTPNPACPGRHFDYRPGPALTTTGDATAADLFDELRTSHGVTDPVVLAPEELVITMPCTSPGCAHTATVDAPASAWLHDPRCDHCGGPWPTDPNAHGPHTETWLTPQSPGGLLEQPLDRLGYTPGASVEILDGDTPILAVLPGDPLAHFHEATR